MTMTDARRASYALTQLIQADSLDREWAAFSRLLDDGLDLPEVARSRWLHDLPAEHDALRPRLRRLLCGSGASHCPDAMR